MLPIPIRWWFPGLREILPRNSIWPSWRVSSSRRSSAPGLPPSSAYLIDKTCCPLLSRKIGCDDMAGVKYAPAVDGHDWPALIGQASIAALICMDATELPLPHTNNRDRHAVVRSRMTNLGTACQILCVPAYTRYFSTIGIATEWPDFHFVLANGWPHLSMNSLHPSVIRIKGRDPEPFQPAMNKVIVRPLEA